MLTYAEIVGARSPSAGSAADTGRVHVDLAAPGAMARSYPGHVVTQDPEGNEFCVEPGVTVMQSTSAPDGEQ